MVFLSSDKFPEAYAGGKVPAAFGARDTGRNSCTPVYGYGWVVSRAELYEAINGEPAFRDIYLKQIYIGAGRLLYTRWREKGYDDNEYNPNVPCVKDFGPRYVLIYMACNDSDAIIKSIMETVKFHEECRACMGNPKMMESDPAWVRVGLRHLPKELSTESLISKELSSTDPITLRFKLQCSI